VWNALEFENNMCFRSISKSNEIMIMNVAFPAQSSRAGCSWLIEEPVILATRASFVSNIDESLEHLKPGFMSAAVTITFLRRSLLSVSLRKTFGVSTSHCDQAVPLTKRDFLRLPTSFRSKSVSKRLLFVY
jgi:hypothetical protein